MFLTRLPLPQVHATDADEGGNADISYGVVHVSNNGRSKFEINSRSGDLDILQRVFSGEQYSITVQVRVFETGQKCTVLCCRAVSVGRTDARMK